MARCNRRWRRRCDFAFVRSALCALAPTRRWFLLVSLCRRCEDHGIVHWEIEAESGAPEFFELVGGERTSKIVILTTIAPDLARQQDLVRCFQALCGHFQPQTVRQVCYRAHDYAIVRVIPCALSLKNERSIFSVCTGSCWRYASEE